MNEGLIPRRYAKALFKVAAEKKTTDTLYGLMATLDKSFRETPALKEVIENPFQSTDDKLMLLRTASGASTDDSLFDDFLALLVKNNRLDMIDSISRAYGDIYRQENNIKIVRLTSAAPLSANDEKRLKELIARHLNGAKMEFTSVVDPSLIGGFAIAVDNERLDASIDNQLKQLRLNLLSKQTV